MELLFFDGPILAATQLFTFINFFFFFFGFLLIWLHTCGLIEPFKLKTCKKKTASYFH